MKHSIGILKSLGIALISFSEFLGLQKNLSVDSNKMKKFVELSNKNKEPKLGNQSKEHIPETDIPRINNIVS